MYVDENLMRLVVLGNRLKENEPQCNGVHVEPHLHLLSIWPNVPVYNAPR